MSFEQVVAALGIMGAILGFFASALGAMGLWIVNGMRDDLHEITEKLSEVLQKMITRTESQEARDRLRLDFGERLVSTEARFAERFTAMENRLDRTEDALFPTERK